MKDYKLTNEYDCKIKSTPFGESILAAMLSVRAEEWEYSGRNNDNDGWYVSYSAKKIAGEYLFYFSINVTIQISEIYRQLSLCYNEEELDNLYLKDCQEINYIYVSVSKKDDENDIISENTLYSVDNLLRDCQLPKGWERWTQDAFDEQLLGVHGRVGFWEESKKTRLKEIGKEESYE